MGLPIVNKIINEHSGEISIKNNKNKEGVNIEISPQKMHKEILVIDDNADIR